MTVPFWCVAVGCILPYLWIGFTAPGRLQLEGGLDNHNPRAQQAKLTGLGARAMGAHQNAFEALPAFIAGVLVAHSAGADPSLSTYVAVAWVVARFGHGLAYVFDIAPLRSVCFMAGFGCSLALFGLGAMG